MTSSQRKKGGLGKLMAQSQIPKKILLNIAVFEVSMHMFLEDDIMIMIQNKVSFFLLEANLY